MNVPGTDCRGPEDDRSKMRALKLFPTSRSTSMRVDEACARRENVSAALIIAAIYW